MWPNLMQKYDDRKTETIVNLSSSRTVGEKSKLKKSNSLGLLLVLG